MGLGRAGWNLARLDRRQCLRCARVTQDHSRGDGSPRARAQVAGEFPVYALGSSVNRKISIGLLIGLLVAAGLSAQQGGAALQFNFSNPGARSLGLGGAFAGLADDATAAFANPAGLVQLSQPEVSIEGRSWSFSTQITEGGRVFGSPTGIGLDTAPGLRFGRSEANTSDVSFLSFVYPKGRGSVSVFRYQLAKFEVASRTNGFFSRDPLGIQGTERRDERTQSTNVDIASWGVAGAYRVTDTFSVGLGIVYSQSDLEIVDREFDVINETVEGIFGALPLTPDRLEFRSTITGDGTDVTFNAGLLWQFKPQWSLGGFYRQGPETPAEVGGFIGPLFEDFDEIPTAVPGSPVRLGQTTLAVPDVFGLGFAWRSLDGAATVSFEWDRVQYSDLFAALDRTVMDLESFGLGDVDEMHFGFEYAFLRSRPVVAVRGGWWRDPAHQLKYSGVDVFDRAIFNGGEDTEHYALGVGLAFESFQVDLGADFSDFVDTLALSGIYSF